MKRTKPSKPKIYPRSAWKAKPGGGSRYWRPLKDEYFRVTAHHDAYPLPEDATFQEALNVIRNHQQTHFRLGWSDIGYHFFICPSGEIVAGRPLNMIGSHVRGANTGNVGICVMGALHQRKATQAQREAFVNLYTWLVYELDLPSDCLRGHRDFLATECPGSFYGELPGMISACKAILSGDEPQSQPTAPRLILDHGDTSEVIGELLIVDGVSYAPVRALVEGLGLMVDWDAETKTATVTA